MENINCENCKYNYSGLCKRYPPTTSINPWVSPKPIMLFPEVSSDDYCGEYKQKKEK